MDVNRLRKIIVLAATIICLNSICYAESAELPGWITEFENPPAWARPQMFFVWNGQVTTERVREMLQQYKAEGIGGVFIHPRPGLITEYLSPEWFEMWQFAVTECQRLGMECHIYDENGFPSGFAGGEVLSAHPELAAHYLTAVKITEPAKYDVSTAMAYFVLPDPNGAPQQVDEEAVMKANPQRPVWALVVRQVEASDKHGGFPYPDVLRRETAEAFIEITHDRYADHFRNEFGKTIKYVFADEPDMPGKNGLPWSHYLLQEFRRQHDYDLRDKIGPLCFGVPTRQR